MASKRAAQPDARAAVAVFPARRRQPAVSQRSSLPSGRSIAVGTLLLLAAAGAYLAARESSLFAVRTIEVRGATPAVEARVRAALTPALGKSLLALDDEGAVERRVGALPEVESASYDRAFPHTLRVFVEPERPVAVLRRGAAAWLVSARGRVLRVLFKRPFPDLPRIWVERRASVSVGATLAEEATRRAIGAVAPLAGMHFPAEVRLVRTRDQELTLVLRSGIELRLGSLGDLRLKLVIARRIVRLVEPPGYVDVSVPERPVAGRTLKS